MLKYKTLAIGGGVALVLLLAGLVALFKLQSGYSGVKRDFQNAQSDLGRISSAPIFPSPENVAVLRQNAEEVGRRLDEAITTLSQDQIESVAMPRAEFPAMLERTFLAIGETAAAGQVAIPSRFAYGFDRYAAGALPNLDQIPRLTRQLLMAGEIVDALCKAGVREIQSLEREQFEDVQHEDVADMGMLRGAAMGMPVAEPGPSTVSTDPLADSLYSKERFTVSFAGRDEAIWRAVNNLSSHKLFIVVRTVTLQNEAYKPREAAAPRSPTPRGRPSISAPARPSTGPTRPPAAHSAMPPDGLVGQPASHEDRVVAGRELVFATLELDVYRFARQAGAEEAAP